MLNERKKNNVNKETTIGTPFLEKILFLPNMDAASKLMSKHAASNQ